MLKHPFRDVMIMASEDICASLPPMTAKRLIRLTPRHRRNGGGMMLTMPTAEMLLTKATLGEINVNKAGTEQRFIVEAQPRLDKAMQPYLGDATGAIHCTPRTNDRNLTRLWLRVLQSATPSTFVVRVTQRNPTQLEILRVFGPGEAVSIAEPVYGDREYASFPHHLAASLITEMIDQTDAPGEWLPAEVLQHYDLPPFLEAVRRCHSPAEPGDCLPSSRYRLRLAIDELVAANLRWRLAVREIRKARPIEVTAEMAAECLAATGFTSFTDDQTTAITAISETLAKPDATGLQVTGDVGTGKTALALIALVAAVRAGRQAALMAPTTALVDQHVRTVGGWLTKMGVKWVQLGGGTSARDNEKARVALEIGAASVAIGTNAIVTSETRFADLGVAVVDETHRFGVDTRAALVAAADYSLQMSATPIPRSMAQVMDGTMKKAHLTQKPGGAPDRDTKVIAASAEDDIYPLLDREMQAGRNVFWVAPAIDEVDDMASIALTVERLSTRYGDRLIVLHGRMKPIEISKALRTFNAAKGAIMIATTVIEVGVDVPHASVIVVEGAENFGLAQLHQLRGRVGRGKGVQGYCLLLTEAAPGSPAMARLRKMEQSQDGFELAAFDLAQRGSGDQLGVAQSGHRSFSTVDAEAHAGLGDLASDIVDWIEGSLGAADSRVQDLLAGFGDLAADRVRLHA